MTDVFKKYDLKKIDTPKFVMSPVELKDFIDFEVKRIYFITKPKDNSGAHCHLKEQEFFIMVQGSCVALVDQGNGIERVPLTAPTSGIFVSNYVWHQMTEFSDDAILLAISSTNYNPNRSDYIEDYEAYLKVRDAGLAAVRSGS